MLHLLKKIFLYIFFKIKYWRKVEFTYSVDIRWKSSFEGMNKLYANSRFLGEMGLGTYLGESSHIFGKIGRFTSIAPEVRSDSGIHPYMEPYVSTSPAFISTAKQNGDTLTSIQRFDELRYADKKDGFGIIIGNDCWIGYRAFLVGGVTIADGAVVLAHSVVTKNVPPFAIVGGIPAKVIKYRFDEKTIAFLLNFKWWNKDIKWLRENIELMNNITDLKNKYGNNDSKNNVD